MRRAVSILVLALATQARAELWTSTLGELMTSATRIEIVHVDKLVSGGIDGRVVLAVHGAAPGDHVALQLGALAAPAVGDDVLVVCDPFACPRAAGIDRGGYFVLAAQEPMDGAYVTPSIVERGSLAALHAGHRAPDLCVRGRLELPDDAGSVDLAATVSAANGTGTGTLGADRAAVTLTVPWAGDERGFELRVTARDGSLELVSDHVARDRDGCYATRLLASRPIVRSTRGLSRVLSGTAAPQVIARGMIDLPAGGPLKPGHHAFTLSVDRDGQLALASDALANGAVEAIDRPANGHLVVGFPVDGEYYPELELDLGPSPGDLGDGGLVAVVALAHARSVSLALVTLPDPNGSARTTPLGTATVTYVKER